MSVTIVLPCLNPPKGWAENIIQRYRNLMDLLGTKPEIILVNDGSDTELVSDIRMLAENIPAFRFLENEDNRGKGYSIRKGVAQADSQIILYTDVDFPYDDESILKIYRELAFGKADIAVGIKNEDYYRHVPPARKMLSRLLSALVKHFLSLPFTDTQCGLKGFHASAKPLFLETRVNRYLFDLEFIRLAHRKGKKISTIPVQLNPNVQFRVMSYRILIPELINFVKILLKR